MEKKLGKETMNNVEIISQQEKSEYDVYDSIIINTYFEISDLNDTNLISSENSYIKETTDLINIASKKLKDGGLLFVYGIPKVLPFFATHLNHLNIAGHHFLFKYWIALECNTSERYQILKNSHIGLLMYLKTKSLKAITPFHLNTKEVRIPYKNCPACGQNIKDWGGKKHLMNPLGTAYSDIWSENIIDLNSANQISKQTLSLIKKLVDGQNTKILVIKQKSLSMKEDVKITTPSLLSGPLDNFIEFNRIVHIDSIEYMKDIKKRYPQGVFDLAFADPPYNLAKNYSKCLDEMEDMKYVKWCNEWLNGMYEVLKPGGALLVLNIPKWAVYHSEFLSNKMNFQHWIVWDALSTPAGKLLPAHYSLLYFTKPGGKPKSNYSLLSEIESRKYCLRDFCIKKRKTKEDNEKEKLSDIWKDIHRIKHKKDRDQHPCQLPVKLMDRIIELFTDKGDIVYDPFGGAGTTAISAKLLNRKYVISELDKEYVDIAIRNLEKICEDSEGESRYIRESVKQRNGNGIPKKTVEVAYIKLCQKHQKVLTKEEIEALSPEVLNLVNEYTGSFKKLMNVCKRKFEALKLIK